MKLAEEIIKHRYQGDPKDFLENKIPDFIQWLLKVPQLDKASSILQKHIENDSFIMCAVDIDCDGIMSGALLYHGLLMLGVKKENLKLSIGSRRHGRGVNEYIIGKIHEVERKTNRKFDLLITADHGTTDEVNYKLLKSKNKKLEIIVTDHHTVEYDVYPKSADVLINPQRKDCGYFKEVCGCGVALLLFLRYIYDTVYKEIQDQTLYISQDIFYKVVDILPYAAIATISDVMPLDSIFNRLVVKTGLEFINNKDNKHPVWDNIKYELRIDNDIFPRDISLYIAPLINTGNRLAIEEIALISMLLTNDENSKIYISNLQAKNKERKNLTSMATREALQNLDRFNYQNSIVSFIDSHAMVNGVVAGNLGSMFQVPSVCFGATPRKGKLNGSARSGIEGINLLELFNNIDKKYPHIGVDAHGHTVACGCNINMDQLDEFRDKFEKESKSVLDQMVLSYPEPEFKLKPSEINIYTASLIRRCGPYGPRFKEPIFTSDKFSIQRITSFTASSYKILLNIEGRMFTAMYFFKAKSKYNINPNTIRDILRVGMQVDVLFHINIGSYKGVSEVQLEVVDIWP